MRRQAPNTRYLTNRTYCTTFKTTLFRAKVLEKAHGDSDRIKLLGAAEAKAVEAVERQFVYSIDTYFSFIFLFTKL